MTTPADLAALAQAIPAWGRELGLAEVRIAATDLTQEEAGLQAWLDAGMHGEMDYMASHGMKRARPAELVPGTVRVITARLDYLPQDAPQEWRAHEHARQREPGAAVVSVYARGRDYHKVLRARLQRLAERIAAAVGAVRLPRLHRFGAGAGSGAGQPCRPWLARQAYLAAEPAGGLDVFSRRNLHRPAAAGGCAGEPTIAAPAMPASTPVRPRPSSGLTGWMRGAAFLT